MIVPSVRPSLAVLLQGAFALALGCNTASAIAQVPSSLDGDEEDVDLTELSLEQLLDMDVEITSVSRKKETVARTAAAVHVISAEDLRRSGARSIPEALRMVPGIQVARLNATDFAVSARGFNGEFANKMLVLVDGRSVYTELFSGVIWSTLDLPLEEIERIEIVCGPGGTMWGTNAVNGVINIITRPARDLDGHALGLRVGTEDRFEGVLRAGGAIGEDAHLRVYTKSRNTASLEPPEGGVESGGDATRGGFRADWADDGGDRWTLSGDVYRRTSERTFQLIDRAPPYSRLGDPAREYAGGNLLLRWERDLADGGQMQLLTAFTANRLDTAVLSEDGQAVDVDFQRRVPLGERHDLVWGLGYRYSRSETAASEVLSLDPANETFSRASAFVQDEYSLRDDLDLVLGTKVEYHDFTGLELQPSARVAWAIDEDDTLWAAVSRAVRTPSLVERGIRLQQSIVPGFPPGFDTIFSMVGDPDYESETLLAYELGWRSRIDEGTSLDLTTFLHDYDDLRGFVLGEARLLDGSTIEQDMVVANVGAGVGYGFEAAVQHRVDDDWTLHFGYSLLVLDLDADDEAIEDPGVTEALAPRNQAHVRSLHDLSEEVELDLALFYVDHIGEGIGSYVRGDVRLGWRPLEDLSLSLSVQNLFHDEDVEFEPGEFGAYDAVETSVHLGVQWSF